MTYVYNINNTTNIGTKLSQLEDRINVSYEITVVLTSIVYNGSDQITVTFSSPLSEYQIKILGLLIRIIIEESEPQFYIDPRIIVSTRYPHLNSDVLNGYHVGDVLVNIIDNTSYTCYDNSIGNSVWILMHNDNTTRDHDLLNFSSGGGQYYASSSDGNDITIAMFNYDGSNEKTITEFSVVGGNDGTATGEVKLVISGINTVIATVDINSGTVSAPENFSTTTISNLPATPTVLAILFNRPSGGVSDSSYTFSAKIKY